MRLFIASDLHGSALYGRQMLEAYHRENADALLLLGDILYHGPRNDLPDGYAPKELTALLSAEQGHVFGVRGNCDAEIDQTVLPFPLTADYCLLFVGGRTVFATHGHIYSRDCPPPLRPGDFLLKGHTHVSCCERFGDGLCLVNPGSVSLPKNGSERGYMLLTEKGFVWKTLEGTVYRQLDL